MKYAHFLTNVSNMYNLWFFRFITDGKFMITYFTTW